MVYLTNRFLLLSWIVFFGLISTITSNNFYKFAVLNRDSDCKITKERVPFLRFISRSLVDENLTASTISRVKYRYNEESHSDGDLKKLIQICGGRIVIENKATTTSDSISSEDDVSCSVLVSTSIGSSFLDKKKRLQLSKSATVADLKFQLQNKFPGSPPVQLQRVFFGIRLLNDSELVSNLTSSISPIPIILDMMSGTSAYNKTMSISQALEAYAACTVQQAYVGGKLCSIFQEDDSTGSSKFMSSKLETASYRDLFETLNQTLHEKFAEDIALSLEEERNPETESADTLAWRSDRKEVTPLMKAFAMEFDLNFRGLKHFAYYSILLVIFAWFGTTSEISSQFLLCMLPMLWISKLRQLRLVSKLGMNLLLPVFAKMDFFKPLLPAPLQVIGIETAKLSGSARTEHEVILPKSKQSSKKGLVETYEDIIDDVDEEHEGDEGYDEEDIEEEKEENQDEQENDYEDEEYDIDEEEDEFDDN